MCCGTPLAGPRARTLVGVLQPMPLFPPSQKTMPHFCKCANAFGSTNPRVCPACDDPRPAVGWLTARPAARPAVAGGAVPPPQAGDALASLAALLGVSPDGIALPIPAPAGLTGEEELLRLLHSLPLPGSPQPVSDMLLFRVRSRLERVLTGNDRMLLVRAFMAATSGNHALAHQAILDLLTCWLLRMPEHNAANKDVSSILEHMQRGGHSGLRRLTAAMTAAPVYRPGGASGSGGPSPAPRFHHPAASRYHPYPNRDGGKGGGTIRGGGHRGGGPGRGRGRT
jgi:hypothetical protein